MVVLRIVILALLLVPSAFLLWIMLFKSLPANQRLYRMSREWWTRENQRRRLRDLRH